MREMLQQNAEQELWKKIIAHQGETFITYSGLPFSYEIRRGKRGEYTRELWIDRRENSKSLAWSSVMLAYCKLAKLWETDRKPLVAKPKALGDIRGITYIYAIFYRFGLLEIPEKVKKQMQEEK